MIKYIMLCLLLIFYMFMTIGTLEIMLIASTVLEFNPLLQAVKIIKLKQAQEVSLITYLMVVAIGAMWLMYGIKIQSLPLIIGNIVKLFAGLSVVFAYLKYKKS